MKASVVIILIVSFMGVITFLGCIYKKSRFERENRIIEYGTKEFDEFVEKAPIKPEKAWELQYYKSKANLKLILCVNDEYFFTIYFDKNYRATLSGYYVNSKTGEVRYVEPGSRDTYRPKKFNYFKPSEELFKKVKSSANDASRR